jgi:hypothetical protein
MVSRSARASEATAFLTRSSTPPFNTTVLAYLIVELLIFLGMSRIMVDVDSPRTRTRTPLTLEDAFFLELRDDALSASLRASEVLRELGDG